MKQDTPVAPVKPDVTEADLLDALGRASIRQLVRALDPGSFKRDHGSSGFTCPRCHHWRAKVLDEWRWRCTGACASAPGSSGTTLRGQGTRLELRRRVAEDYGAATRLVNIMRGVAS